LIFKFRDIHFLFFFGIGIFAAVLTLAALVIRFCITTYVVEKKKASVHDISDFISFLIHSITVVVVAIPEGLVLY
jgi:magnesium-transporting ATPase (P-type)